MKIIVTDVGMIWNHNNPFLEKYRKSVIVVCLEGKVVTDKYDCFVSPFEWSGKGDDPLGTESQRYLALESVGDELNRRMHYHDDILILSDGNPASLYPYWVLKDRNKYNKLHLCAMPPWAFEGRPRSRVHRRLMEDLNALTSFLYMDSEKIADDVRSAERKTYTELINRTISVSGELLPRIITGIKKMNYKSKYFFDFATMSYIPTDEGFSAIEIRAKDGEINEIDDDIYPRITTLGIIVGSADYPIDADEVRNIVERTSVRVDGKEICNMLREKRILLAEVNGITFESEVCPSIGACAGTCPKCDEELQYLIEELVKIPVEKRVYPYFDLCEGV